MISRIFTVLVVVAGVLAQVPSPPPQCYDSFGNNDSASCARFIGDFCDTLAQNTYRAGDTGSRCYMVNRHRCDFTLFNTYLGGGPIRPSNVNCKAVLNEAVRRCSTGGRGKINPNAPFLFAIDPNDGTCNSGF